MTPIVAFCKKAVRAPVPVSHALWPHVESNPDYLTFKTPRTYLPCLETRGLWYIPVPRNPKYKCWQRNLRSVCWSGEVRLCESVSGICCLWSPLECFDIITALSIKQWAEMEIEFIFECSEVVLFCSNTHKQFKTHRSLNLYTEIKKKICTLHSNYILFITLWKESEKPKSWCV